MEFVLCGDDPAAKPLCEAIVADPAHRLTLLETSASGGAPLLLTGARQSRTTSELEFDAAIIAGADPEHLEWAKTLAAAGKPLLVFPSAAQGSVFAYELTLIHDDTRVLLLPQSPRLVHPEVLRLKEVFESDRLGTLLHLQMSRTTAGGESPVLRPADIDRWLLEDVTLLRELGGNYSRVTALQSGRTAEGVAVASVSLAGPGLPEVMWTLRPPEPTAAGSSSGESWQLVVTGERGRALLTSEANGEGLSLALPPEEPGPPVIADPGPVMLARFLAALSGEAVRPDWGDLTRSFETVDAARRSIDRRRTIDLHFEATSERSLFKTQMTAIGCGLLTVTFLGVLALLLVGAMFDTRDPLEVKAEAVGFILHTGDFQQGSDELSPSGDERLRTIANRMSAVSVPVLIEQEGEEPGPLDEGRRQAVIAALEAIGRADAPQRTLLAELQGTTFRQVMQVGRVLVFVPLFLFLVLQLLLVITRPSARRLPGETSSEPGDASPAR